MKLARLRILGQFGHTHFPSLLSTPTWIRRLTSTEEGDLSIKITEKTISRLKALRLKRKEADLLLRVEVNAGGCSGFQYEMGFAYPKDVDEEDGDIVVKKDGVGIVVDASSMKFVKGATLDYVEDFLQRAFVVVDNPNVTSECGCHVSFTPTEGVLKEIQNQDEKS